MMKEDPVHNPVLVHEYLTLSSRKYPDKEALICGEERWTYLELERVSSSLAQNLREMGFEPHDRGVIFLDNSSEAVISLYSILKAGGTFVILNGMLKAKKLAFVLRDCGAKILIAHVDKADVVLNALDQLADCPKIIWVGDPAQIQHHKLTSRSGCWKEIVQVSAPRSICSADKAGTIDLDLAALIYTSGSTGEPKGVMSSHFNIISAARSIIQYLENNEDDKVLSVLPLSFDYGLYQVLMAFMFGGTVVLENSFAYPNKIIECIPREQITGFPLVPTIAALLLRMQNLTRYDLSSLRYLTNTAAVLPVEHIRKLQKIFHPAKIYSMYGLTECKRVSYLPPEELEFRAGSVGKAIPNCQVFISDEDGNEVGPGGIGELIVRGANVMRGYWNAPELTAKTFRQGRYPGETFLYSGDLFRKDEEGFLYFVARKDEQIKTKGERVSPREIENSLCELQGIVEAAVVGVPDEILGQAVKCFVVCLPGSKMGAKDILRHCADNLEPFMVPKYVEIIPEMPRTAHGKIDKNALKNKEPDPLSPPLAASAKPLRG